MRRCNSPGAHGGALPPVQNGAVQNGTLTHSERDAAAQESSDSWVSRAVESPQAVVGAAVPAARVGCVDTSWRQHAVAATACLSALAALGCRKFRNLGCPGLLKPACGSRRSCPTPGGQR